MDALSVMATVEPPKLSSYLGASNYLKEKEMKPRIYAHKHRGYSLTSGFDSRKGKYRAKILSSHAEFFFGLLWDTADEADRYARIMAEGRELAKKSRR